MKTLASRVALATAIAVAVAGLVVALTSIELAHRFVLDREDAHLVDAASTLATELDEPRVDPVYVAADETRELAQTAIAIAIYDHDRFIAGDRRLLPVQVGHCADIDAEHLRACAVQAGIWTAIAGRDASAATEHREASIAASIVAVLLTTLLGATIALLVARVVLAPLSRLRAAVETMPIDHPGACDLGRPEGVAEIDALRESLRDALSRLDASLAQSRRFSRDAAHELRTPLTTILGELDLAAEHGADEHVVRVRRVADRLATLVERLLILSQVERPTDAVEEVELLDVVEDAVDDLGAAGARVVVEGAARVRGDRALLRALVGNAVENALKFSSETVRVEIEAGEPMARIAVEDRGPGVPAGEREHVFDAFYRGPDARVAGVPGHGIGLALIAHVVAMHRGEVRFADTPVGARLEIALPSGS